jgi:putative heme iron utilization protein
MTVDRAHLVGGFARSVWLKAGDVTTETGAAAALSAAEGDILAHMNADHADAIDLYAARLLGRKGQGWRLIGIDPDGCDLGRDGSFARLPFPRPATDPDGLRNMLIELAAAARSRTK